MQTRKNERNAQKIEFRNMAYDGNGDDNIALVRLFCIQNFIQPKAQDGSFVDASDLEVNMGARLIMLAVEPNSLNSLMDIFSSPIKEARRSQIDNKSESFSEKWEGIAKHYFNAEDFSPDNLWVHHDERIKDIDPSSKPPVAWSGEMIRKYFQNLKTKFALIDSYYVRSGNLEAGVDIQQADMFYTHILRIASLNKILLY